MSNIKAESQPPTYIQNTQTKMNQVPDVEIDKKQNLGSDNVSPIEKQNQRPQTANIFAQANQKRTSFNIFSQSQNNEEKKNIFQQKNKSVNLFNISSVPQTNNSSIFKSGSKPLVKPEEEDDQKSLSNASSEYVNKQQSDFKNRPDKLEMKFKYENPWQVLKHFDLRKFKNGVNPSKEHIYLTFEIHSNHPDKTFILVRAKETKVMLFQGFGMKDLSDKVLNFMNNDRNIKFSVIRQNKRQNEENMLPLLVKEQLKLQFQKVEDANELKSYLSELFGSLICEKEKLQIEE